MPTFTDEESIIKDSNGTITGGAWAEGRIVLNNGLVFNNDGESVARIPDSKRADYAFTIDTDTSKAPENQLLEINNTSIWLKPVDPETFEIVLAQDINNYIGQNLSNILNSTFTNNGIIDIVNQTKKISLIDSRETFSDNKCLRAIELNEIRFAVDFDIDLGARTMNFGTFLNISPMAKNLNIKYQADDIRMYVDFDFDNVINPTIQKTLTMGIQLNDELRVAYSIQKIDASNNKVIDNFKRYSSYDVLKFKRAAFPKPNEPWKPPFYQAGLNPLTLPADYNIGLQQYLEKMKFPQGNAGITARNIAARDFTTNYFRKNMNAITNIPQNTLTLQQLANKFNFVLSADTILDEPIANSIGTVANKMQESIKTIHHEGINITIEDPIDLTSGAKPCSLKGYYYRVVGIEYSYDVWLDKIKFYWQSTDDTSYIHGIQFVFDPNNDPLLYKDCFDEQIIIPTDRNEYFIGYYDNDRSKKIHRGYDVSRSPVKNRNVEQIDGAGLAQYLPYVKGGAPREWPRDATDAFKPLTPLDTSAAWMPCSTINDYGPGFFYTKDLVEIPIHGNSKQKQQLLQSINPNGVVTEANIIDLTLKNGDILKPGAESDCLDAIITPANFTYNDFEKQYRLIVKRERE